MDGCGDRLAVDFLLILNLVMVVLGCVIEIFSAIIVVAPLVVPVANAFGVDPCISA